MELNGVELISPKDRLQMEMAHKVAEFWKAYGKGPRRHRKKTVLTDDEKSETSLGAWVQRHNTKSGLAQDFLDDTLGKKWRSTTEIKLQMLEKKKAKEVESGGGVAVGGCNHDGDDYNKDDSWINYNGSLSDPFNKRCPWFIRTKVPIPPKKSLTVRAIASASSSQVKRKKKIKLDIVKKEKEEDTKN